MIVCDENFLITLCGGSRVYSAVDIFFCLWAENPGLHFRSCWKVYVFDYTCLCVTFCNNVFMLRSVRRLVVCIVIGKFATKNFVNIFFEGKCLLTTKL